MPAGRKKMRGSVSKESAIIVHRAIVRSAKVGLRIFKTKWFARYVRRERIAGRDLSEAIARAERGLVDADLGGGIIKQRVA